MTKRIPANLRIRSPWLPPFNNEDMLIPPKDNKDFQELFKIERHWGLILFRFRWGHQTYELKVNKDDELELVKKPWRRWS